MRIHHVALRTSDLGKLEEFYVDVLGFEVMRRDREKSVWLRAGEAILMLEHAAASEPAVPLGSMEMLAFAVSKETRAEYTQRLRAAGVPFDGETAFTVYVRDPDGRRIGLSHYPEG